MSSNARSIAALLALRTEALLNAAINTPPGEERRLLWVAFREAQADLSRYRRIAREEEAACGLQHRHRHHRHHQK